MRERLASRLGFLMLSAGCAIGLGNVWRFPYIAGQNGGGWFVAIYLMFLVIVGVPVLIMEFAAGRAAQCSIAVMHAVLTPERKLWRLHGFAGAIGCTLLMMFYTTVTGWMLLYFLKSVAGAFSCGTSIDTGGIFTAMLSAPVQQIVAMVFVTGFCAIVCAAGLQKGLERVTKYMMLGLLVLIVVLAVRSITLAGAEKGVAFYLVPDFARLKSVGVAKVLVEAMNHAFFTLSLGIGSMAIFGSYIGKDHTLVKESLNVAAIDTFVALTAGLVVIPACFAFGIAPEQGPGLVFVTLPNVFNQMPLGRVWCSIFFLFMSAAALTTVLAVFECIIASARDYFGWSRGLAAMIVGGAMMFLALPCIFGFNLLSGFTPFGAGTNVLDLEDFLVSNILLPLGGLCFVIYCSHRCGWGWNAFVNEANLGSGLKIGGRVVGIWCRFVLPLVIFAVFAIGLIDKFVRGT